MLDTYRRASTVRQKSPQNRMDNACRTTAIAGVQKACFGCAQYFPMMITAQKRGATDGSYEHELSKVRTSSKRLREKDVLTPEEFRALLAELSTRHRSMVLLAGSTGMRRSELMALGWSDLDLEKMEISITNYCFRNHSGDTKTEASRRPVPLHPLTLESLLDWKKERASRSDSDFLFPSVRLNGAKPLSADSILKKSIRPALIRAGIVDKVIG
jgi:integrase